MPKRKRRDLRKEIVRASSKLFARKGYDGVSVEEIAQELGVSKSSIFWHFGSKKALYEEVVKENIRDLELNLEMHLKRLSPGQKMLKLLDLCVDFLSEHREFIQILTRSSGVAGDVRSELLKANRLIRREAVKILREAGFEENGDLLADGIMTLMHGLACQMSSDWFSSRDLKRFRKGAEYLLEWVMNSQGRQV